MDPSAKADQVRSGDGGAKMFEKIVYFASGSIGDDVSRIAWCFFFFLLCSCKRQKICSELEPTFSCAVLQVAAALKNSSAESTCLLSDSVTHCVVGENCTEADVSAARELYDVPTVTPQWIRMSVLCNRLLPYPFAADVGFPGLEGDPKGRRMTWMYVRGVCVFRKSERPTVSRCDRGVTVRTRFCSRYPFFFLLSSHKVQARKSANKEHYILVAALSYLFCFNAGAVVLVVGTRSLFGHVQTTCFIVIVLICFVSLTSQF